MHPWLFRLALASLPLMAASAAAQVNVVETPLYSKAEPKIGKEYRAQLNAVWEDIQQGKDVDVVARLLPAIAHCDAQARPGRRIVSVATTQEYEQYMAENATGEPTEWLDIACPTAYYTAGYLHAGTKQWNEALVWLDRAIAIAPYMPDPHNERAYVLGQSGRLDEAMSSYQHALQLADTFPSAAYIRPLALRGIGWVLIEKGDLDAAQQSYEASLEIDPGNPTAIGELEYIAKSRAKQD